MIRLSKSIGISGNYFFSWAFTRMFRTPPNFSFPSARDSAIFSAAINLTKWHF